MTQIKLKQNKKDLYLDLSTFDIHSSEFADQFKREITNKANFFNDVPVTVVLQARVKEQIQSTIREEIKFNKIYDLIKEILDSQKILLKGVYYQDQLQQDKDKELLINEKQVIINQQLEKNIINYTDEKKRVERQEKHSKNQEENNQAQEEIREENTELSSNINNNPESEEKENIIGDDYNIPQTLYVKNNLRSGQLIKYPGNVIIQGDINPSAEIIANGDVIVWGSVRGIIHAGANGDREATIAALNFQDAVLRIDNLSSSFTTKNQNKGFFAKNNTKIFSPNLAKIQNNEIIVLK